MTFVFVPKHIRSMTMPIPVNASSKEDVDTEGNPVERSAAKDDIAACAGLGKVPQKLRRPLADFNNVTSTAARSSFTANNTLPPKSRQSINLPLLLPRYSDSDSVTTNPTMQAIRLQKKYPEVTQEEMFDLINRFKYVVLKSCCVSSALGNTSVDNSGVVVQCDSN